MLASVKEYFSDFLSLVYPEVCRSCGNSLNKGEGVICMRCEIKLPQTDFHLNKDNPVARHLWGRVNLENATSFYYFQKGSRVQHLIHQLKYRGKTDVGVHIGKQYGRKLRECEYFNNIDLIIPIPLHFKKQRYRGYNQSDFFAQGLSEAMEIPFDTKCMVREHENVSQTKKSRFDRWKNVEHIFALKKGDALAGKHILIVDDVVTTGATLEAASTLLLQLPNTKVSVATIACAIQ